MPIPYDQLGSLIDPLSGATTLAFDGFGVLFIIGALLVAGFGGYFAWKAEQKRREALKAWAAAGGWRLDKEKRSSTSYPIDIFDRGHSRYSQYHAIKAFNDLIDGIDEPALFDVFQYHYAITTNNGKSSSTTHYYNNCLAVNAGVHLGRVGIRDEGFGDKIAAKFGRNDIDFEDPDFSSKFHVSADNRKDAFDLIHHSLMRYMMSHAGQGLYVFTLGSLLFVYQSGRADADRYERLIRFAGGFLQQIPRTMVNAERARRGLPALIEAGAAATRARHLRTGEPRSSTEPSDPEPTQSPQPPEGAPRQSEQFPGRNPDPDGPARLF